MSPRIPGEGTEAAGGQVLPLGVWLRARRSTILGRWERAAGASSKARGLDAPRLLDHLPTLIDELASEMDTGGHDRSPELLQVANAHALARLDQGYDLADVVSEYSVLRRCIHELFEEDAQPRPWEDVVSLNRAIDEAVKRAVTRYTSARGRTLQAIDRIAAAALEGGRGSELLQSLLKVLIETTASVDTASLFLQEDGGLVLRAQVGLSQADLDGLSAEAGARFAATVAAACAPTFATEEPVPPVATAAGTGVRALYGVPLLVGDNFIGVAMMGSQSTRQFSDEDRLLFRTMANRATGFIVQALNQEQSERRADELEAVINSIPEGVCIGDETGLTRCNLAFAQMLGFDRPDEVTRGIAELANLIEARDPVTGKMLELDEQPFVRATRGDSVVQDIQVRQVRTGAILIVRCSAAPLRRDGKVVGAVATHTDVTGQKQVAADAAQALSLREKVMGILSHELRDPLSTIRVASALLLREGLLPEGLTRTVQRADHAADRMARLVGNLLDFTQTRFLGPLSVAPVDTDIVQVCEGVVEELEAAFPGRNLKLSANGETRGNWDPARFAQILSNLAVNALRYGDPMRPVRVAVDAGPSSVRIEVHNWGEPISPELLPKIFEPFRRGAGEGRPHVPGLGLGLYIVDQIVRAHGGTIGVTSSEQEGTTFAVTLPRALSKS